MKCALEINLAKQVKMHRQLSRSMQSVVHGNEYARLKRKLNELRRAKRLMFTGGDGI